ncbi:alpha-L-rhamnosidase [Rathayibacter phage NCPPB3778]|nr:alpha-L-rhamnosidase [Rathayibacter phage NCPPB3778]
MHLDRISLPGWGGGQGIDDPSPRIQWTLAADASGESQSAYRVQLSTGYDTGKVYGTTQYAKLPILPSLTAITATITVWDASNSTATKTFDFSTGPMSRADWRGAKWITVPGRKAPQLRKTFTTPASGDFYLHIAGAGNITVYVDGVRVTGANTPGMPSYSMRRLYRTIKVPNLAAGQHVVAVHIGRGWFAVESTDAWRWNTAPWKRDPSVMIRTTGVASLITDEGWRATNGQVINADAQWGEVHDMRLATPGWTTVGYDDASWTTATISPEPNAAVVAARHYPEPLGELIDSVTVTNPAQGRWIAEFPEIISGTARVTFPAIPAGTKARIIHGEYIVNNGPNSGRVQVYNAGELWASNFADQEKFQSDIIIFDGAPVVFEADLSFKSVRYVEIFFFDNPAAGVAPTTVQLRRLESATPIRATFACNEPILTRLFSMAVRSELINLHNGAQHDTSYREKIGWTGDSVATRRGASIALDIEPTWRQWTDTQLDDFRTYGIMPVVSPAPPLFAFGDGVKFAPEWGAAIILLGWENYLLSGNSAHLAQVYERTKAVIEWFYAQKGQGYAPPNTWVSEYGDWASTRGNGQDYGKDSSATAYMIFMMDVFSKMSTVLGRTAAADLWAGRVVFERNAWAARLYSPSLGAYLPKENVSPPTFKSAPTLLAYELGVEPAAHGNAPIDKLATETAAIGDINVGLSGAETLLTALYDRGHADLAMQLLRKDDEPSWGHGAAQGATTLWDGFGDLHIQSTLSHHMHGGYLHFMIIRLAGIRPTAPGEYTIVPSYQTNTLSCSIDTGYGPVGVSWNASTLTITVPPGTKVTFAGNLLPSGTNIIAR